MLLLCVLPILWMATAQSMTENWMIDDHTVSPIGRASFMFNRPSSQLDPINNDNILVYSSTRKEIDRLTPVRNQNGKPWPWPDHSLQTFTHQVYTPNSQSWINEMERQQKQPVIEISELEDKHQLKDIRGMDEINQNAQTNTPNNNINQSVEFILEHKISNSPKSSKILHVNDFPSVESDQILNKQSHKGRYASKPQVKDQLTKQERVRVQEDYLSNDSDLASRTEKVLFSSFISTLVHFIQLFEDTSAFNSSITHQNISLEAEANQDNITLITVPENSSLIEQFSQTGQNHTFDPATLQNFKLNQDQNLFQLQQYTLRTKHMRKKKIYFVLFTLSFGIVSIYIIKRAQSKSVTAQAFNSRPEDRRMRLPSEQIQQI